MWMRASQLRWNWLVGVAWCCLVCGGIGLGSTEAQEVTPKIRDTIERDLIPAIMRGDSWGVVQGLAPLVAKLNRDELTAMNAYLAKHELASAESLLLDARLNVIRQADGEIGARPGLRESLVLIPELRGRIQEVLDAKAGHPISAEPLMRSGDFQSYESLFRELHVLRNRFQDAEKLATFGQAIVERAKRGRKAGLTEAERAALEIDFGDLHRRLEEAYRDLEERKTELQVQRIDYAASILERNGAWMERLQAVYAIDLDGELIARAFASLGDRDQFHRPTLRAPGLTARLRGIVDETRARYPDMVINGDLLFTGLHWWMRGRYGAGPDGYGLLKSVAALETEQGAFALYMPTSIPVPTAPASDEGLTVPAVDRRHHLIWMFEYRKFLERSSTRSSTTSQNNLKITSKTTLPTFY